MSPSCGREEAPPIAPAAEAPFRAGRARRGDEKVADADFEPGQER